MGDGAAVHCSVSLFSGGGVGDLGVQYGAGVPVIACAELVPERAALLRHFFPDAAVHEGDLWDTRDALVESVRTRTNGGRPLLVIMSPPCQGMSANGAGRIASAVKKGTRPIVDQRNRLILPALDVVDALNPDIVILENVKRMATTTILNENGEPEQAVAVFRRRLAAYRIEVKVIDFSTLGVPQRRIRLIGIATRDRRPANIPLHPLDYQAPITLAAAIGHLPPLDGLTQRADPRDEFHVVPAWTDHQHFCMRHTPEGGTAFDNLTCVACEYVNTKLDAVCLNCSTILPRPSFVRVAHLCLHCGTAVGRQQKCPCGLGGKMQVNETRHVVRAFRTAYRRMHADRPAPTLTTNSGVISSDIKGHPTEHRVLSLREVLIVATVCSRPGFDAPWWSRVESVFAALSPKELRDVLGESIPPLVTARLVENLLAHRELPV